MTKRDKKLIANFMGYDVVRIGYYGTPDETRWQRKNREWLDKPEIIEQYDNSIGDYFVNVSENIIIDEDEFHYDQNWNDLMPVVERIAEYRLAYPEQTALVCDCKIVIGIQYLYPKVVNFIKWYNNDKQNQK